MDYPEYLAEEHLIDVLLTISNDIKNRITTMGELFVRDKIIDLLRSYIRSILFFKSSHPITYGDDTLFIIL